MNIPHILIAVALFIISALFVIQFAQRADPTKPPTTVKPYNYTALGDSLTAGVGAEKGFVPRLTSQLSSNSTKVNEQNHGVSGATIPSLQAKIDQEVAAQDALKQADLVTLTIGGNDLLNIAAGLASSQCTTPLAECAAPELVVFRANWQKVIATIRSLMPTDSTLIVGNIYYPGPLLSRYAADREEEILVLLQEINSFISQSQSPDYHTADIASAFAQSSVDLQTHPLISEDNLHPNAAGHEAIAEAFYAAWEKAQESK